MMEIGYVAARRGLTGWADTQRNWFDATYAEDDYKFWDIDQIGFRLWIGG